MIEGKEGGNTESNAAIGPYFCGENVGKAYVVHHCGYVCVCEYFGWHKSLSRTNSAKRQYTCE